MARKRIIAELALEAASTGVATFPDGTTMELSVKDWMDMLWKVYGQVDGPPKAEVDVTSGGEQIMGPQVFLPRVEDEE